MCARPVCSTPDKRLSLLDVVVESLEVSAPRLVDEVGHGACLYWSSADQGISPEEDR